MKKTSLLALLGKNFPEKLGGLSVKGGAGGSPPFLPRVFWQNDFPLRGYGGEGYPPLPLRFFWQNDFPLRGIQGRGYPLSRKIPLNIILGLPLHVAQSIKVTNCMIRSGSRGWLVDTYFRNLVVYYLINMVL